MIEHGLNAVSFHLSVGKEKNYLYDECVCVWSGFWPFLKKGSELSCSIEGAIYCDIYGPITGRGVDALENNINW